jgi:hypothetical protein
MEQQDFCKNPFKPNYREIERVRQSEMEMSEAKREKGGSNRCGNEEERGEMRERIN